jgi:hypothetical protein
MRQGESDGRFATHFRRRDKAPGAKTQLVREKGPISAVLERQLDADFAYRWRNISADRPFDEAVWPDFLESKRKFDPDFWAIELDVADAQRFVAETTAEG